MTRERKSKLFIAEIAIPLGALLAAVIIAALPVRGEEAVYDGVVRLHVLANSDSDADQAVKLKVRDAVLAEASDFLAGCGTEAEAQAAVTTNLDRLKSAAVETLEANGFYYGADVTLGEEFYSRREYDGFYLPEGTYMSARVLLGEARGKNWWCILFPPLCTANAEEYGDRLAEVGFTPYQIKLLTESDTPRYKLKFRIVELIREWFGLDKSAQ